MKELSIWYWEKLNFKQASQSFTYSHFFSYAMWDDLHCMFPYTSQKSKVSFI